MGWFKKKEEVIDLTKLKESGVLERSQRIQRRGGDDSSGDVVDLSSGPSGGFGSQTESGSDGGSPAGDFLSALAGANTGKSVGAGQVGGLGKIEGAGDSVTNNLRQARFSRSGDVNALKNKLEDMEYKFEKVVERLERLEGE